jgi:GH35 family endo-1,4-beta-xylanase
MDQKIPQFAKLTISAASGVALCILLAVGQVALGGYQMGVGNQSIQIAFLERAADRSLFPLDEMVNQTMPLYPSYFFVALAPFLKILDVQTLYLGLHILTSFLSLAAVYWLSRSIFRTHTGALAAVGLLIAGHLQALAGDGLYSEGFTHTFVALPIAVLALGFAYRGWWFAAFAVAGELFNIHALTSAYVLLMLGAGLLADIRQTAWWRWLGRAALGTLITITLAAPTLKLMLTTHQHFDADWVNLMRIRSADHSFPSAWWASGDPDLPRFALLLALFGLSWSFTPVRRATSDIVGIPSDISDSKSDVADASTSDASASIDDPDAPAGDRATAMQNVHRASRMTALMTIAVLSLFAIGYLFTEIWPVPLIIRLQPFRASRLLMVLMLVHIAHGAVAAIRAAWCGRALGTDGYVVRLSIISRAVELIAGITVLLTIGIPVLLPLLPISLIVVVCAALVAGHLSWRQSLLAAAALDIAALAHQQIDFPLWLHASDIQGFSGMAWDTITGTQGLGGLAIGLAAVLAVTIAVIKTPKIRTYLSVAAACFGILLGAILFARDLDAPFNGGGTSALGDWARQNTPRDAIFLAPSNLANFRVQAERSLIADWRDGTQLYFSGGFGPTWISRIRDIEPGLQLSQDGQRLVARGDDLDTLSDQELLDLARKYHQDGSNFYIVLKTPSADRPRALVSVHSDDGYTVYVPELVAAATRPMPKGVVNPIVWNDAENFMASTVLPNIEKYRKSDVTIQIVDQTGRAVQNLAVDLNETKSAFNFGASLGFFEAKTARMAHSDGDQIPPPVRPIELEKLPEVFNASMIPFSSKWAFIEPQKGVYNWSDLDKYVDYCTKNDLTMEYHHLTGIRPPWVAAEGGSGMQVGLNFPPINKTMQEDFDRHCLAVLDRYQDKIKYYQVVNEKYDMQYVPEAWKILKAKYPNIQFGISDCVNFWDPSAVPGTLDHVISTVLNASAARGARGGRGRGGPGETLETKGLDAVPWLLNQGIKPDFFSMHGHHPADLWPDPREMYSVIDHVTALCPGMRIHFSEEYLQIGGAITGPLRKGTLTPQLQAECLVRYFTIGFSNPAVDMINLWGGMADKGWTNSGLIDSNGKTTPAFDALKKLFNETFHSHVTGELGIDGAFSSRVFQGKYAVTVTLADGKQLTTKINVPQQASAKIRLRLNSVDESLEQVQ